MSETCARFETLLSPTVDGELAPAEAKLVRAHTTTCARCAAAVAEHEAARRRIRDAELPAISPEAVRAMLATARQPSFRWRELAAAVLLSILVPAAIAVASPRPQPRDGCACDVVSPALDTEL